MKSFLTLSYYLFLFCSISYSQSDNQLFTERYAAAKAKQADQNYKAAISLFDTLLITATPSDSILADIYHRKGLCHYFIWELLPAINAWQSEIELLKQKANANLLEIGKIQRNISSAYFEMNRFDLAEKNLEKAIENLEAVPKKDTIRLAKMYMMLGNINSFLGDYEKAENLLLKGLPLIEDYFSDATNELERAYSYFFVLYEFQRAPNQMIDYMNKALEAYSKSGTNDFEWIKANAYNNLGIAYELKEDWEKAINYYQLSIAINNRFEDRKLQLAKNYLNLSTPLSKINRFDEALSYLKQAKKNFKSLQSGLLLARAWSFEGDIYYEIKAYKQALQSHQIAINELTLDFQSDNFYQTPATNSLIIGNRLNFVEFLDAKAKTFKALAQQENKINNLQAATATYDTITKLIDLIRTDFDADESKSFLASNNKPIFESAIAANLELHEATQNERYQVRALELAEQSKAMILLDALNKTNLNNSANIPNELVEEERALREEIAYIKQDIWHTEQASEDATGFRDELVQYSTALERLVDTINAQYPKLQQMRQQTNLLNVSQLRSDILAKNQALIQYHIGDSTLVTYYVDQNTFKTQSQAIPDRLVDHIEQIRELLVKRQNEPQQFTNLSTQLYDWLLKEILPKNTAIERLIIVPDDVLAYLPFELLLTKPSRSNNFNQLHYLIKDYAISYSYSGSILARQLDNTTKGKAELVAFAPSYDKPLDPDTQVRLLVRDGKYDLPGAKAEVEAIGGLVNGQVFTGETATEALFKSIANDYRYLHLSMHGLVEDEQPMRSRLLFYETADSTQDAMLHAYELYNTNLSADMVVLSACNTGVGKLQKGGA